MSFSCEGAGPGPLQQQLREPGLRIDPRSFPDLPQSNGEEAYRQRGQSARSSSDRVYATCLLYPHINDASAKAASPMRICSCPLVAVFGKPKIAW